MAVTALARPDFHTISDFRKLHLAALAGLFLQVRALCRQAGWSGPATSRWIAKYDLWDLEKVGEVRAGIDTRNLAISHDGRVLAVANYLSHTLVLPDAGDLSPLAIIPAVDARGKVSARFRRLPGSALR